MKPRSSSSVVLFVLVLLSVAAWAQSSQRGTKKLSPKAKITSSTASQKKQAKTKQAVKSPSTKARANKAALKPKRKKPVSSARLRRVARAFVTSADLKPMARQLIENRTRAAYSGVEAYARKHAGTDAGALAWLAVGYAHILDRDYDKALLPLEKAQPRAGELGDYVLYFKALSYGSRGDSEKVIATLKDFTKTWPESVFLRDAVDVYGDALVAAGRPNEAVEFLEANRQPTRADVELALGRAYLKAGNPQKAAEVLRHIYYTMPGSGEAAQASTLIDTISATTTLAPASFSDRMLRARLLAQSNRWTDAAREDRALLNDAPPDQRANVSVALGVALRRSGNASEGRRLLEQTEATGEANAERLYNLGEIARSEDNESAVIDNLGQMRKTAATSSWFESALLSAGNMYLLKRDYDKAIDQYREIHERFPNGPRASYAHWKATWLNFRQGRNEEARREFEKHVEQYPRSVEVAAALYWRARLAEESGDLATARAWYAKAADRFRNYYYGHQARERLAKLGENGATASVPLLDRIPSVQALGDGALVEDPPGDDLRVQKSKLLENAGLFDLAIKELQLASGGKGPNWATLQIARIYRESGQYHRALQFLKRALPSYYAMDISDLPRPYWEFLFPRPYWTDLRKFSTQNRLDPYLVASLIRQESEFNPGAISHANAWGLMQLLPAVGKGEARELKVRRFNTEQLLIPNLNLQLGTRFFREMVDHQNGQIEYALAAYNAGTNRVQDWLDNGKYRDVVEFVESIPFTETREYVQAIMRNAQVYRKLYPNN
ncbi:MAG TPA: transglycosylase SLT domain-containing protein [Clostridia bacterium]|nr:transglycosylase SLT domain-containing protein [Clostridia bacterium]